MGLFTKHLNALKQQISTLGIDPDSLDLENPAALKEAVAEMAPAGPDLDAVKRQAQVDLLAAQDMAVDDGRAPEDVLAELAGELAASDEYATALEGVLRDAGASIVEGPAHGLDAKATAESLADVISKRAAGLVADIHEPGPVADPVNPDPAAAAKPASGLTGLQARAAIIQDQLDAKEISRN